SSHVLHVLFAIGSFIIEAFTSVLSRSRSCALIPYTTLYRSAGRRGAGPAGQGRRPHHDLGRPPSSCRRGRAPDDRPRRSGLLRPDLKSTRLNSSHVKISYAVFCLKKKSICS